MNSNLNVIRRIFAACAGSGGVHGPRRWLMALALYALCLSPALAYFPGQSLYHFRLYQGGYDSREYTDTNALCTDAVASHAQAMGMGVTLKSVADESCYIEYQTTGIWFPGADQI